MKKIIKSFNILLFFFVSLFFTSCKENNKSNHRIYLTDNWEYSIQGIPYPFTEVPDNNLDKLSDLLDNQIGYVFIKNTFVIPDEYKHKDLALNLGRVKVASKVYINNHSIGNTAKIPDDY